MKFSFKTKIRTCVFGFLLLSGISIYFYTGLLNVDDRTSVDKYYGEQAEEIVKKLKKTDWGKSSRGKKILNAFATSEIRIITPSKIMYKDKEYSIYEGKILNSPAEGMMAIERGVFRIYISVYDENDLDIDVKTIDYMNYKIPEDEFIHILIDELLSRHQRGYFFIDGEASRQEEEDAWLAAEEAVKAFYDDDSYSVRGLSHGFPNYGPNNIFYMMVR